MTRKEEILAAYRDARTQREAGEKVAPGVTRQRVQQIAKEQVVNGYAKHHAEVTNARAPLRRISTLCGTASEPSIRVALENCFQNDSDGRDSKGSHQESRRSQDEGDSRSPCSRVQL